MQEAHLIEQYSVRVAGSSLRFSAAHFITFADGRVEPLHGHDYGVAAEITGTLGPHGYVADFLAVRKALEDLIGALDHRTLLPERHPESRVDVRATEIEVMVGPRRWVLPREDCVLLPIANTTSEALAGYLAAGLLAALDKQCTPTPSRLRVEVSESPGFTAACTLHPS